MHTIRKRLSVMMLSCVTLALILVFILVNVAVKERFNTYIKENQAKRDERIVNYLRDIYVKNGKWDENTGLEVEHEAYMGNFCVTLLDASRSTIWGMNPKDILKDINSMKKAHGAEEGIYESKEYPIKYNNVIVGYVQIGQYSSIILTAEDKSFETAINRSIIISTFVSLVITFIIAMYLVKQFSTPIKEMANKSVKLARGEFVEDKSERISIIEINNLKNSMDTLSRKLNHISLIRKRLVSEISHELRTPLNVLQNNLEAMIDDIIPISKNKLIDLNNEVIRFGNLVNDLNMLKEFEIESIKLDMTEFSIGKLTQEVMDEFRGIMQKNNLKLLYENQCEEDYIVGDRKKIKQVLINVMSNAVKFNRSEGSIEVKVIGDNKTVAVEFKDTGIGISKEEIPHIFDYLYRGDKSKGKIQGKGIGLSLVKDILELHSAKIEVESEENAGSKFIITFFIKTT
ncbi:HAMP domain-containing histidine kinase [Clostridium sp. 19966]|uniref:sensor histidine kinase n=1 Tax=Clostridium sp. 19966 TaxID=2768166 RepID=UPI0028DE3ED6|nr:HAMP domain-containing sensor histidine kinase [Clostridium sp. 19966]MDT8716009.1 HAMP domain-containing histidine kinase [Clostridium sp. 19966]